ncbi:MAG: TlpA family protein disulfide reductase [Planctomycetaceae bacterium]|jgi:peroxiredoxin|nr:TlpA family protein disulfide reductase [Planctomycetaceae bacterium]
MKHTSSVYRRYALAFLFGLFTVSGIASAAAQEAAPSAKGKLFTDAMSFTPLQKGVIIDSPSDDDLARCDIKLYDNNSGFIITGPRGEILRVFRDTTGDKKVDQWSYYRNNLEVYRDIDTDHNGKADNFRWFHSGGSRWGVDANEDGVIDYWKAISPDELSAEIVLALSQKDTARFMRTVLTADELKSLQLGEKMEAELTAKIASLQQKFTEAVNTIKLSNDVEWYQFGGSRTNVVPAGRDGNGKDVYIYENGIAVLRDGAENKQLAVAPLVQLGENNWRTIDVPRLYDESGGIAYFVPQADNSAPEPASERDKQITALLELQNLLPQTAKADRAELHDRITRQILNIVRLSTTREDQDNWMRQLADAIMVAVQENEYPKGTDNLEVLFNTINKDSNKELAAYIRLQLVMSMYYKELGDGVDPLKAQITWLDNLEKFCTECESTEAGAEGIMRLASYRELVDQTEDALKWYQKALAVNNPNAQDVTAKITGAVRRLSNVGKTVQFQAKGIDDNVISLAQLRGSYVMLYFWDSQAAQDLPALKLAADKLGIKVISVNFDSNPAQMKAALSKIQQNWLQINAPTGTESPIANYWGIHATPMTILFDKEGKIVTQKQLSPGELETVVK